MKSLFRMNITNATLLPGLDGLPDSIRMELQTIGHGLIDIWRAATVKSVPARGKARATASCATPLLGYSARQYASPRLAMQERNGHLGQADDQQGGDHPSKARGHVDPGSKTNASQEFHITHSPLGDKPHEQNTRNPCPTVRKEQESLN